MKRVLLISGSPQAGPSEFYQDLASRHDLIIAVDSGADVCMQANIGLDVFIGDQDSVSNEGKAYALSNAKEVREYKRDKDFTDFELALDYINELNRDSGELFITITNIFGNRIDHMLAAYGALFTNSHLDMAITEPNLDAWILDAKQTNSLHLKDVKGETFSLISFTRKSTVSLKGFKWDLKNKDLDKLSGKGVSNLITKKHAQIHIAKGKCLAILYNQLV